MLDFVNRLLSKLGWKLQRDYPDYILYDYASYDEYREEQVRANKFKIERVWAESQVLDLVIQRIQNTNGNSDLFGICHGSRNGFEQEYFRSSLGGEIIGTDISDTAVQFPNSIIHDFHNTKDEWISRADFVYSNSLDQSWNPKAAISVWIEQLKIGGVLFVELSHFHSPFFASKMDPFGVKPEYFAYLLTQWVGHKVSVEVLTTYKTSPPAQIWLYEIIRNS
jgi:hypothetical protein